MSIVWEKIKKHEGECFWTKTKKPYTYTVYCDYILVNNEKSRRITKDNIEKALLIENPIPKTIEQEGIWGPSYVYGIITDNRIKNI